MHVTVGGKNIVFNTRKMLIKNWFFSFINLVYLLTFKPILFSLWKFYFNYNPLSVLFAISPWTFSFCCLFFSLGRMSRNLAIVFWRFPKNRLLQQSLPWDDRNTAEFEFIKTWSAVFKIYLYVWHSILNENFLPLVLYKKVHDVAVF